MTTAAYILKPQEYAFSVAFESSNKSKKALEEEIKQFVDKIFHKLNELPLYNDSIKSILFHKKQPLYPLPSVLFLDKLIRLIRKSEENPEVYTQVGYCPECEDNKTCSAVLGGSSNSMAHESLWEICVQLEFGLHKNLISSIFF